MRTLIVFGSPNGAGNTAKLLSSVEVRGEADLYCVFDEQPGPCTDCGHCKQEESCKYNDLDAFYALYEQADIVIFASPVYNSSFPAPMKALLDRFQRYYNARFALGKKPPVEKTKQAMLLLTQGSADTFGFRVCQYQIERLCTVLNTKLIDSICVKELDQKGIPEKFLNRAKETYQNIYEGRW